MIDGIYYTPVVSPPVYINKKYIKESLPAEENSGIYSQISRNAAAAVKSYAIAKTRLNKPLKQQFDVSKVPQEMFTKEGINFNTKPEDYIKYLKENNIDFKVEKSINKYNDGRKIIQIIEDDGNLKKYTSWDYDDENTCNYSALIRDEEIIAGKVKRTKRLVFTKDRTELIS